ncbi:MAG TPA: cbb3-type cytochrome c oxidase subunit I, partial [Chloroflexota bacterium]
MTAVAAEPLTTGGGVYSRRHFPGQDLVVAVFMGIIGFVVGSAVVGATIAQGLDYTSKSDQNDVSFVLGCLFGVAAFLIGLGFLGHPLRRMLGHRVEHHEIDEGGIERYFRMCTDHKVVGIQYFFGVMFFFFVAGLNAMFMRTQLLFPTETVVSANQYISLVSLHGTMMMQMMSAVIIGPIGNYFVPIMIGAKRMAFPRLEALSFWLVPAASLILLSSLAIGGFPTGWTGYASLADQAKVGMDCYLLSFALIAIALAIVGFNMVATIVTMRAPGLTWGRLPIFVWA